MYRGLHHVDHDWEQNRRCLDQATRWRADGAFLASRDTDLVPALDEVYDFHGAEPDRYAIIETVAWIGMPTAECPQMHTCGAHTRERMPIRCNMRSPETRNGPLPRAVSSLSQHSVRLEGLEPKLLMRRRGGMPALIRLIPRKLDASPTCMHTP